MMAGGMRLPAFRLTRRSRPARPSQTTYLCDGYQMSGGLPVIPSVGSAMLAPAARPGRHPSIPGPGSQLGYFDLKGPG
jgi:hypothetical protein